MVFKTRDTLYIAIPLDITLPTVLVPNHFFLAALPQNNDLPKVQNILKCLVTYGSPSSNVSSV
jgi:hypothetical protein